MNSFAIESFFHQETFTWSHILVDKATNKAAIVDPVLDYRPEDGHITTEFADQLLSYVAEHQLQLEYLLETHIHADHLSAGDYLRQQTQAKIVVGENVSLIQQTFSKIYNEASSFPVDGRQFDILVGDNDVLQLGQTSIKVLSTPGHTPACVSYLVNNDAVFIGDTLFMSDTGSARCDFPAGDAGTLYDSVQKLFALGDEVVMYLCHDYPPTGRALAATETVGQQRQHNIHLGQKISRAEFIKIRTQRDAGLSKPRLILPSLQVNIRAGALPEAEDNGVRYLKVPLNLI